jgi:hypothetical protein
VTLFEASQARGARIVEKTRAWADEVAADDLTVVLVDCA